MSARSRLALGLQRPLSVKAGFHLGAKVGHPAYKRQSVSMPEAGPSQDSVQAPLIPLDAPIEASRLPVQN